VVVGGTSSVNTVTPAGLDREASPEEWEVELIRLVLAQLGYSAILGGFSSLRIAFWLILRIGFCQFGQNRAVFSKSDDNSSA
jgi:hypothetical protein